MHLKYADATHISCAYRLRSPQLDREQGYEDDGETGQGRAILKAIKDRSMLEICVFVVRYYGGKHLGSRCYEIARDLTYVGIRAYKVAQHVKMSKLKALQRHDSQLSLLSETSATSYEDVEEGSPGGNPTRNIRNTYNEEK